MAVRGFRILGSGRSSTVTPLVYTVCVWLTTGWVPGRPQKVGIRSMMRLGHAYPEWPRDVHRQQL